MISHTDIVHLAGCNKNVYKLFIPDVQYTS